MLIRRAPRVDLKRERIELPDGDFVDIDWARAPDDAAPVVLVLHGLEGSSDSQYARGMLQALHRRGLGGAVMHFRGCSGEPNRLARSYHSGDTGDFAYVVDLLRTRAPDRPIAAVGYSLGGNVLLKYLGERASAAPLTAAVAVSVPYLLNRCADRIDQGFSRIYQWELMRRLRHSVVRKLGRLAMPIDAARLRRLRRFWDFDEHVTAPLNGFADAEDYYRRSSSRQFLKSIAVPTLLIHAFDDPFMTPDTPPRPEDLSPAIRPAFSPHGGHVGFVAGPWPWRADYWLETTIPRFLVPLLKAAPAQSGAARAVSVAD